MTQNNNMYVVPCCLIIRFRVSHAHTDVSNSYPHLPIVTNEIIGPPFQDSSLQGSVAQFVEKDGGVALNNASAADFAALKSQYSAGGPGDDYPGCSDT